MLVYRIAEPDVAGFMAHLLREQTFDLFEVRRLEVASFTEFSVSGVEEGAEKAYCTWARIRPFAVAFVRGKKRPRLLRLTLAHTAEGMALVHANAAALMLNIVYENNEVRVVSAVAQREFLLDKSLEEAWAEYIDGFFKKNNIPVSQTNGYRNI